MFNSKIIRKSEAELHFDVMAHLIRKFGPPPRPHVHSPLHTAVVLESLAWTEMDTRSATDWAEDHFGVIKTLCHMDEFEIDLVPAEDGLTSDECAAAKRLEMLASGRMPYTHSGAAQIFYDPRDNSEPGHFVATAILELAELRASDFKFRSELSPLMQRIVTLGAAVYNRQGFVLANLPDQVSAYLTSPGHHRAVPHKVALNNLCFATCLALRIRRQSKEQIIATYGLRMEKSFRRKVHHACYQIESFAEELAILQLLAEPKVQKGSTGLQKSQTA